MSFLKETVKLGNRDTDSEEEGSDRNESKKMDEAKALVKSSFENAEQTMEHYMAMAKASMSANNTKEGSDAAKSQDPVLDINNSNVLSINNSNIGGAPQRSKTKVPAKNINNSVIDEDTNPRIFNTLSTTDEEVTDAKHVGRIVDDGSRTKPTGETVKGDPKPTGSKVVRTDQEKQDFELAQQMQELEFMKYGYQYEYPPDAPMYQILHRDGRIEYYVGGPPCRNTHCPRCLRRLVRKDQLVDRPPPAEQPGSYGDRQAISASGAQGQPWSPYAQDRADRSQGQPDYYVKREESQPSNPSGSSYEGDTPQGAARGRGGAYGGSAARGRGGAYGGRGLQPPQPGFQLMIFMPRREIDSRGLLNEGSRLQDAFSPEEWRGIQRNPFGLLRILGGPNAARRPMPGRNIHPDDYEGLWELANRLGEVKKRGMDPEEIARMPTVMFADDENEHHENKADCKICLTDFLKDDKLRELPCSHRFHRECIDKWIKSTATCPVCRVQIREALKDSEK